MKVHKKCDTCKNKCKIYIKIENVEIFCPKYEKVVNEQMALKIK